MLQPRQHNLLTRLLNLPREEDLIQNRIDLFPVSVSPSPPFPPPGRTHLIKIKHQIQLTHVPEEAVEDLDEEVYGLEERELVVVCVDAGAEEQPRVAPVDDLVRAELDEVALVLLVARRDQPVHLPLQPDLLLVAVRRVPLRQPRLASGDARLAEVLRRGTAHPPPPPSMPCEQGRGGEQTSA